MVSLVADLPEAARHSRARRTLPWPWACAAASGALLALSLPGCDQGWLAWIALTPLLAAVWLSPRPARRAWLRDAGLGYVTGLVFFSMTFSWLGGPLAALFRQPWLVCLPPLLALYLALFPASWGWFLGRLQLGDRAFLRSGHNLALAALAAAAWVAQEWVRGWLFGGFAWNGLSIALHGNPGLMQAADIGGVYGLSFVVAFANAIALLTVRRFVGEVGRMKIRPHWDFSVMMALVVATFAYGVRALQHPVDMPPREVAPLRVAAVQPDIAESLKFIRGNEAAITDVYDRLSMSAITQNPDLLIWPEAATLSDLFDPAGFDRLKAFAPPGRWFLLGSFLDMPDGGEFNIAACLGDNGRDVQIYRKMHLVPFGEYLPMRNSFPLLARIAGNLVPGDLSAGHEYTIFNIRGIAVAPLICFEDTLGDQTRRFAGLGARLLVNITNDAWFGASAGSAQHLANACFRAVENRRPLVRAANTGITCFIDCEGRTTSELRDAEGKPFIEGWITGVVNVPVHPPVTLYTRLGDWPAQASAAVALLALGLQVAGRALPRRK